MKRNILILTLLIALIVSCSTTQPQGKTYNVLPLDISREDFEIISEENYYHEMTNVVEPYLDSIKKSNFIKPATPFT